MTIDLKGDWIKLHFSILTNLKRRNYITFYSRPFIRYRSGQSERTISSVAIPSHKYLPNHLRQQNIMDVLY